MDVIGRLEIHTRSELRQWFLENHSTSDGCWITVSRSRPPDDSFWYLDAVEEALCFGWIDSTQKIDVDGTPVQRLSPRKKNSRWSELNKERCRRLEKLGLMTDAGRAALPDMSENGFTISPKILSRLNGDHEVLKNLERFPSLYVRVRIDTIQSYSTSQKMFDDRLDRFIENTRKGKMYGKWDDYGRLSEIWR